MGQPTFWGVAQHARASGSPKACAAQVGGSRPLPTRKHGHRALGMPALVHDHADGSDRCPPLYHSLPLLIFLGDSMGATDRKNEDKLSKGLESNFMPFEADGRYNRVFDMAEEGIEVSDVELATKFTHRMDKQRSPRERRARASPSASPLASPTRGVPRGGTLVAGVNLGPDPNTYTQGPEIGLAFTPTNVSLNASKLTKRKGEQFGSPSGTPGPRSSTVFV